MTALPVEAVLDLLPQTQCRRCGYDDCRAYATAIVDGGADVNRCPPGGAEGVARLARLTGRPARPLDPACGTETPRAVATIDEAWCIGCALCLSACPVDAIVGAAKRMHTVVDALCTGCELCVPVCPVDCIAMTAAASGERTGWAAWSAADAAQARTRYAQHAARAAAPSARAPALAADSAGTHEPEPTRHDTVAAAVARARARAAGAAR